MKFFCAFFACLCGTLPAFPVESSLPDLQTQTVVEPLKETQDWLRRVEEYWNGLQTLSANVTFSTQFKNGKRDERQGVFYLNRQARGQKGHHPTSICVAFGSEYYLGRDGFFYIRKNKKTSKYDMRSSPVACLFDARLSFQKYKYVQVFRNQSVLSVVVKTGKNATTSLTLFFSLYPNGNIFRLIGWMLVDFSGNTTKVIFDEASIRGNIPLDSHLFDLPKNKQICRY